MYGSLQPPPPAPLPCAGKKPWVKADPNFIGYTYKNWEAVQEAGTPGHVGLRKKAPARPSIAQVQNQMSSLGLAQPPPQQQ
jgi:hypothetical protein